MKLLEKYKLLNPKEEDYQSKLLHLMSAISDLPNGISSLHQILNNDNDLEVRTFTFLLSQKANEQSKNITSLIFNFIGENHNKIRDQSALINLNTATLRLLIHDSIDLSEQSILSNFTSFICHCLKQSDLVQHSTLDLLRTILEWEYYDYFFGVTEFNLILNEINIIHIQKDTFLTEIIEYIFKILKES